MTSDVGGAGGVTSEVTADVTGGGCGAGDRERQAAHLGSDATGGGNDSAGGGGEERRPSGPPGPGRRPGPRRWREATDAALYGADGFYSRAHGPGPAGHFRTSVHASSLYAHAVTELLRRVDAALGHPSELAFVDVGAGRGELLTGVLAALAPETVARLRPYAVERAPRPPGLDPRIDWMAELPAPGSLTGLLFANEWLDNIPADVAETAPTSTREAIPEAAVTEATLAEATLAEATVTETASMDAASTPPPAAPVIAPHYVLVRPDGGETLGAPVTGADAEWLRRWWPLAAEPGLRAEIGRPRDAAWARAVAVLSAGLAVAADYCHDRAARPPFGTLTGFREGREVRPVPDGSCDITSHVALDACAGPDGVLLTQRAALRALGVDGRRPPLSLAAGDPVAYVRALSTAGEAAELTDPAELGSFGWLVHAKSVPLRAVGLRRAPEKGCGTVGGG